MGLMYMPNHRYVLCPGYIRSQFDGDEHYIGVTQLAHLYGVDYRKCTIVDDRFIPKEGDIYLRPRYRGDYNLEKLVGSG